MDNKYQLNVYILHLQGFDGLQPKESSHSTTAHLQVRQYFKSKHFTHRRMPTLPICFLSSEANITLYHAWSAGLMTNIHTVVVVVVLVIKVSANGSVCQGGNAGNSVLCFYPHKSIAFEQSRNHRTLSRTIEANPGGGQNPLIGCATRDAVDNYSRCRYLAQRLMPSTSPLGCWTLWVALTVYTISSAVSMQYVIVPACNIGFAVSNTGINRSITEELKCTKPLCPWFGVLQALWQTR